MTAYEFALISRKENEMADDYNVTINGEPDGRISRLGLGHAWVWTRKGGQRGIFDSGCAPSHVLDGIAARVGVEPRAVQGHPRS